ncbi:MAG TPA: hypothetical protein PKC03_04715 [Dokdonella sp.]|nr:hypothetical protein [Dokdonella sp.]
MYGKFERGMVSGGLCGGLCLSLLFSVLPAVAASKAKPGFEEALTAARSTLVLADGKLSGDGAGVLSEALAGSRYVLIGEDHFSREIPHLVSAICDVMHPDAYAVEAGPQAAQFVTGLLKSPDRVLRMKARMLKYAHNMAFLDANEENDTAAHCALASRNPDFPLWGLDQEFIGAAGPLLDAMAAAGPGPRAAAAIAAMQVREHAADEKARASGDPGDAFIIAASDAELQLLANELKIDGNAQTTALFDELVASNSIYRLNFEGSPRSNSKRAELFKQHFLAEYAAIRKNIDSPRVLFKFGDNHSGKGFSPLQVRDIGNFVAEFADGERTQSLHLLVLAARGKHALFGGYAKPVKVEPFAITDDPGYQWLTPAIERMVAQPDKGDALSLFDLRKLRFRGIDAPSEWRRIIHAYDLLVLLPEITPASMIQ